MHLLLDVKWKGFILCLVAKYSFSCGQVIFEKLEIIKSPPTMWWRPIVLVLSIFVIILLLLLLLLLLLFKNLTT